MMLSSTWIKFSLYRPYFVGASTIPVSTVADWRPRRGVWGDMFPRLRLARPGALQVQFIVSFLRTTIYYVDHDRRRFLVHNDDFVAIASTNSWFQQVCSAKMEAQIRQQVYLTTCCRWIKKEEDLGITKYLDIFFNFFKGVFKGLCYLKYGI